MISTQRLILMIILLNLIIASIGTIYQNADEFRAEIIQQESQDSIALETNLGQPTDWWQKRTDVQTDSALWNTVTTIGKVIKIFMRGLTSLDVSASHYPSIAEKMIAYFLMFIRGMTIILCVIEVILFAISKKST